MSHKTKIVIASGCCRSKRCVMSHWTSAAAPNMSGLCNALQFQLFLQLNTRVQWGAATLVCQHDGASPTFKISAFTCASKSDFTWNVCNRTFCLERSRPIARWRFALFYVVVVDLLHHTTTFQKEVSQRDRSRSEFNDRGVCESILGKPWAFMVVHAENVCCNRLAATARYSQSLHNFF